MTRRVEVFILGDSRSGQKAFRDFTREATQAETKLQKTAKSMQSTGQTITRSFSVPVAGAVAGTVAAFGSLDSKMTQSTAIMGDVGDAMRKNMAETAKRVSQDLNIAASDAAEGYFFLASAGMDATQAVAAMPQVAAFAKAGMFDLATATDLATDAQSALGLASEDASENLANLTRVTDVLVGANTLANASVQQFSEALTNKAGAALRIMNKDVEEGVAVLAALADQGTKGAAAGEALSIVLRDVGRAAAKNSEGFAELGIEVFDADGNMRNLADVIGDMEGAFGGLDDATLATTLEQLGLTRAVGGNIKQLLGTSEAVREYEGRLRDMSGVTQDVAGKQMEAFNEQLGVARQRVTNAASALGEQLAPKVLTGANAIASLVEGFAGLPGPIRDTVGALVLLTAASGPAFIAGGKLLGTYAALAARLKVMRSAQTLTAVGTGIEAIGASAVASSRGLGVMAAIFSPTGVLIAGLAAAAAAFYLLKRRADSMAEAHETAGEAASRLADSAGLAYEEIASAAGEAGDAAEQGVNQFANANARAIAVLKELDAESQRAYLINVGWELVQHGNTTEQAFGAIQRLADAAGIEIPVDLDADDLADISVKLQAIRRDAELVGQGLNDIAGGLTNWMKEDIAAVASAAADAFKMDDIEGAIAMLVEFDQVIQDLAPNQRQAKWTANELVDQFRIMSGVHGLNVSGLQDLTDGIRDLVNEEAVLHDSTRTSIEAFLAAIDAGASYEEALEAMEAAAAGAADAERDKAGASDEAAGSALEHADAMGEEEEAAGDLAEETRNAKSAIEELSDAKQAASNPVFALIDAMDGLNDANQRLVEVQEDETATAEDAAAAALDKAKALARLEAAAVDGALDFGIFTRRLDEWVAAGELTAAEAAEIRDRVAEARGEAEKFQGRYDAEIALEAAEAFWTLRELGRMLDSVTGRRDVAIGGTLQGGHLVGTNHAGGVIDRSPTGGRGGLRPDERMRVRQVGEEVLTPTDPRHVNNLPAGGGGGGLTREDLRLIAWAIRDGFERMRIDVQDNGVARDLAVAGQTARR